MSAVPSRFAQIVRGAQACALFVIPIALDDKIPRVRWKAYQKTWPSDADTMRWIRDFPDANGAFVTGKVQGRFVLDADSPDATE
jgi:hypothetical protein